MRLGSDRRSSVYGELGEIQAGTRIQIAKLVEGVTRARAQKVEVFVMGRVVAHPFRLVKHLVP